MVLNSLSAKTVFSSFSVTFWKLRKGLSPPPNDVLNEEKQILKKAISILE